MDAIRLENRDLVADAGQVFVEIMAGLTFFFVGQLPAQHAAKYIRHEAVVLHLRIVFMKRQF